jgi:hypothetical protein
LKLINTELAARLTRQDQSMSRVETKSAVVIGFAVTAAQFLATRHPFSSPWSILFGLSAFLCYIAAFTVGVWTLRVEKFKDLSATGLRALAEQAEVEVLRQLIGTRRKNFEDNKLSAVRKARGWWWSTWLLAFGLLLSIACMVLTA